ncbi:MAG: hypothetical protein ABW196_09515 [Solirubrobacterales bacterium]
MRNLAITLLAAALIALAGAPGAAAEIGFKEVDVTFTDPDGNPAFQSGSHAFSITTSFAFTTKPDANLDEIPTEPVKDLDFGQIEGLAGDATTMPTCTTREFLGSGDASTGNSFTCPVDSAVGTGLVQIPPLTFPPQAVAIYNLEAPRGYAARLGFKVLGIPIVLLVSVNPEPPFNIIAGASSNPQTIPVYGAEITIWGDPSDPRHDENRGECVVSPATSCEANLPERPFLTLPRACLGPLETTWAMNSWLDPDNVVTGAVETHDEFDVPHGFEECDTLGFGPEEIGAAPTTNRAESPSGFDFTIEIEDEGLIDPKGRADSDLKKAVVTLPEGLTVNPAAANGLDACSAEELARETASSPPGDGCPDASRVADVKVETPLLDELIEGSIFLAEPFDNPLGTLLAGYLVLKQPERGIVVKLVGAIETDPSTGRITASFDENPQFPFSRLEVSFPGGPRAALTTPQSCGTYGIQTELYPWSGNAPVVETDEFEITEAAGGGACPGSNAALPLAADFDAGTVEPLAGRHSAFVMNLRREDGSQRFRRVTLNPPPGLTAKLAGTPPCSDAALAKAAGRKGITEQASPSCPSASRLGSVFAAAGSGPDPYWAPGVAYLAGPYKGAPLSLAVVTPAVAGPFDLGTIVTRVALYIDPQTARISAVSDPIPHILEGIPLDVRTVSVRIDKPQFTLNPTSCDPLGFDGWLISTLGAQLALHSRFQVAECGRLGFRPRVSLRLFGPVRRGGYQGLRAVVRPRPGDANVASTVVRFPRSAFVAQEHIRTVCTRVQFAADACPPGSIYGRAIARSPLLDYPLQGNVYLRSSDNELPDALADLRGPAQQPIRVELAIRNDSVGGALRNTVQVVPDAPVSYFRLDLFGKGKGLIVNSRNICTNANRATISLKAQNGERRILRPMVANSRCKNQPKAKRP